MSANRERQVRCLVQRKPDISMASQLAHGLLGHHTCSEPLAHEGDHLCGGVAGCGCTWPRAT